MRQGGDRVTSDDIMNGAVTAAKLASGLSPAVASIIFADGTVQTTAANATNTNAAQAYQTTGQSIPNTTQTPVVFDTLSFSQSSPGKAGSRARLGLRFEKGFEFGGIVPATTSHLRSSRTCK